MKGSLS